MTTPMPSGADLTPAGPKRQQRGIQLPQLLLSLLVVAVFALLAVWWQASSTSRSPVVALAVDIEEGQALSRSDLTEIYISSDVPAKVTDAARLGEFIGARPVTSLSAGTMLTTEMFVGGSELEPGQAFVGLVLDSDQAPVGIVTGDRVQVLAKGAGSETVSVLSPNALVESADYDAGQLRVRLRLDLASAQQVQVRSGQVVIIEIAGDTAADWETGGES